MLIFYCLLVVCASLMANGAFLTLFNNRKIQAVGWLMLSANSVAAGFITWTLFP